MSNDLSDLTKIVTKQFRLDPTSPHGPNHWMRVKRNGLELAEKTGANKLVVELFAIFHDSCRVNDNHDKGHGKRGAKLAKKLYKMGYVPCSQHELDILVRACDQHTGGENPYDITVATCWDADRLDLPRVGIEVNPDLLCTEEAKDPEFIELCRQRALDWADKYIPEHHDEWELSPVRKAEPKKERVVIYISGRGGNTDEGLGGWLKSIHENRIGLSVNQQFLSLNFDKQVQVIQDLVERFDAKDTLIIANSYGAYMLAHALLNIELDAQMILLSPVLGRGVASNSMFVSIPPGESRIAKAMKSGGVFENFNISVHVGEYDDSANVVEVSKYLGIKDIHVVGDAMHNLPIDYVQQLITSYLEA